MKSNALRFVFHSAHSGICVSIVRTYARRRYKFYESCKMAKRDMFWCCAINSNSKRDATMLFKSQSKYTTNQHISFRLLKNWYLNQLQSSISDWKIFIGWMMIVNRVGHHFTTHKNDVVVFASFDSESSAHARIRCFDPMKIAFQPKVDGNKTKALYCMANTFCPS